MFNFKQNYIEDEYRKEINHAVIHMHDNEESNRVSSQMKFTLSTVGIIAVGMIGYFGFNYMQSDTESVKNSAVMGVSIVKDEAVEEKQIDIRDRKAIINSEAIVDNSSPHIESKEITGEIDSMVRSFDTQQPIYNPPKKRVIEIKKGDTLGSISRHYYGDSIEFQKIIDANRDLTKSTTLYIGQKINIPY